MTDDEIEDAYEAANAFLKKVKELRQEMIDDALTPMQIDYIIDYLHDNFRLA